MTLEMITNEMLSELNLVNVNTRVKQLKLNHVHKIVNNKCPAYMKENFVNVKDFHKYQTRFSEHNFIISDWNSLPEKLKTIQDNKKFKFELKTFLRLHNQSKVEVVYMYYLPMDTVASM